MKAIHWIILGCGGVAAVGAAIAPFLPPQYSNAIHGIDAGALALVTYLGLKSPAVLLGGPR
jgi:hypothetical protein